MRPCQERPPWVRNQRTFIPKDLECYRNPIFVPTLNVDLGRFSSKHYLQFEQMDCIINRERASLLSSSVG